MRFSTEAAVTDIKQQKAALRKALRKARREHADALPSEVSALVFRKPPAPIAALVPEGATIGLYRNDPGEAPTGSYARHFMELGHPLALPRIDGLDEPMTFRAHTDPYGESDLEEGRMGLMQPSRSLPELVPQVLFMPLVGFSADGNRIGQGGGFYDKWLAAHPGTIAIGMAWDVQLVDHLPLEPHDMPLTAIITPTRIYGPF